MAGTQRLLAMTMAFSLAGIPRSAKPDALGIIVQADHASLGSQAASEGTTIYDGDRLSTDAAGSMRFMVGEAIVYLPDQSCVTLHKGASGTAKEFEAELVSGKVALSVAAGTGGESWRVRLASGRYPKGGAGRRLASLDRMSSLYSRGEARRRFPTMARPRRFRKENLIACY
jgi:hypothetical protein